MEGPVCCLSICEVVQELFGVSTGHVGWENGFIADLAVDLLLLTGQVVGLIGPLVGDKHHIAIRMVIDDEA